MWPIPLESSLVTTDEHKKMNKQQKKNNLTSTQQGKKQLLKEENIDMKNKDNTDSEDGDTSTKSSNDGARQIPATAIEASKKRSPTPTHNKWSNLIKTLDEVIKADNKKMSTLSDLRPSIQQKRLDPKIEQMYATMKRILRSKEVLDDKIKKTYVAFIHAVDLIKAA